MLKNAAAAPPKSANLCVLMVCGYHARLPETIPKSKSYRYKLKYKNRDRQKHLGMIWFVSHDCTWRLDDQVCHPCYS